MAAQRYNVNTEALLSFLGDWDMKMVNSELNATEPRTGDNYHDNADHLPQTATVKRPLEVKEDIFQRNRRQKTTNT